MKLPFWSDPNEKISVLEANDKAMNEYGHRFGSDTIVLTEEHIAALRAGKMLAWNDSEYSTFVVLESSS